MDYQSSIIDTLHQMDTNYDNMISLIVTSIVSKSHATINFPVYLGVLSCANDVVYNFEKLQPDQMLDYTIDKCVVTFFILNK